MEMSIYGVMLITTYYKSIWMKVEIDQQILVEICHPIFDPV
jgi:hypothetical protein